MKDPARSRRAGAIAADALRRLPRYYLLAALTDFALYVVLLAAAHQVLALGGGALQLGLVSAFWAVPYVLVTALGGGPADRYPRDRIVRVGAMIFAVATAIQAGAQDFARIYASVLLVGTGLGLFWPALQAAIADASFHNTLERNLGSFNVAWSLGKALGFLAGGLLYENLGAEPTVALASGVALAVAMGMPKTPHLPGGPMSLVSKSRLTPAERRRFRYFGWIANFGTWGLGATVIHLYPEMNEELGRGAESFGILLAAIYFSQTASFVALRRWRGWIDRMWPLVAVQVLGASLVLLIGLTSATVALALAAAGIGLSLGMGYYASITYSLRTDESRGQKTGRHEAVLGSANFLLPLMGGTLAYETGCAESPYLLAAAVVLVAVAIQVIWWLRAGDGGSREIAGEARERLPE